MSDDQLLRNAKCAHQIIIAHFFDPLPTPKANPLSNHGRGFPPAAALPLTYRKWSISDKTYFPSRYAANKEKPRDLSSRTNRGLIGQIAWFLRDASSMQFHFRPLFFSREMQQIVLSEARINPLLHFTLYHLSIHRLCRTKIDRGDHFIRHKPS